jgi:integrase
VDLSASPVTVKIEATLVNLKGVEIVRQEAPKMDGSLHIVLIPQFGAVVLRRRIEETETNALGALFVTRNGTWVSAHNVRRGWRAIRSEVGLEWVVPHTFRKTVATTIEREYGNVPQTSSATRTSTRSARPSRRSGSSRVGLEFLEKLGPRARPDPAS